MGKPVVVGGLPGQRGVVTAASYEVRAFGVRSGMSLTKAVELAPHAIYLPTRHGVYGDYAVRVRRIAEGYTPVSQVASIDEMFLDFSGCESLYFAHGDRGPDFTIERTVRRLTDDIQAQVGLPSSAGIATSRSVAKVASGLAKPRGVLMVPAGTERAFLAPLPVRKFPGIGPVAEQKLVALGMKTLGERGDSAAPRARAPIRRLGRLRAARLPRSGGARARSRAPRLSGARSVGQRSRHHLERAHVSRRRARPRLHRLDAVRAVRASLLSSQKARREGSDRLAQAALRRLPDTLQRSRSITPTCSELELYPVIRDLFDQARTRRTAIRLLGICLSNLRPSEPTTLALRRHRSRCTAPSTACVRVSGTARCVSRSRIPTPKTRVVADRRDVHAKSTIAGSLSALGHRFPDGVSPQRRVTVTSETISSSRGGSARGGRLC